MAKFYFQIPTNIQPGERLSVMSASRVLTLINNTNKTINSREPILGRMGTLEKGKTKFIFINDYDEDKKKSEAPIGILINQSEFIQFPSEDRVTFSGMIPDPKSHETYVMASVKPGGVIQMQNKEDNTYFVFSSKGWTLMDDEGFKEFKSSKGKEVKVVTEKIKK